MSIRKEIERLKAMTYTDIALETQKHKDTINKIGAFLNSKTKKEEKVLKGVIDKTDYFVKFASNEDNENRNGVFARTKNGSWYGIGDFWNSGLLDLDGKLTGSLEY